MLRLFANTALPDTKLFNAAALMQARDAIFSSSDPDLMTAHQTLTRYAGYALEAPAESVLNKTLSIPGVSAKNYISIGIYNHACNALPAECKPYPGQQPFHPADCDNATGLPWTGCDGIKNPAAINMGDSPAQMRMVDAVSNLALGAFYEQNATTAHAYLTKATSMIRTWFLDSTTGMLPNLFYGQIQPHQSPPPKGHGGFIEWVNIASFLDYVSLIRFVDADHQVWTQQDDQELRTWFTAFLAYIEGPVAANERNLLNNHATWFHVVWQSVAQFVDPPLQDLLTPECSACSDCGWNGQDAQGAQDLGTLTAEECQATCIGLESCNFATLSPESHCHLFSTCKGGSLKGNWTRWASSANAAAHEVNFKCIAEQILPNGTEWVEVQRNDALHYSIYNLQAFANNGDLAELDVWNFSTDDGRSIRKAMDWILQYATGQQQWPYGTLSDDWSGLHEPLRQAAHAFQEPAYETAACQLYKASNKTDYKTNIFNLRLPPQFKGACDQHWLV